MKLDKTVLDKLDDDETRAALNKARSDDSIQLVLTVNIKDDDDDESTSDGALKPDPGESRIDFRRRLIASRLKSRSGDISRIVQQLSERLIEVKGGESPRLTRNLVVEGKVADLVRGLQLTEIIRARIDRAISIDQPARPNNASQTDITLSDTDATNDTEVDPKITEDD